MQVLVPPVSCAYLLRCKALSKSQGTPSRIAGQSGFARDDELRQVAVGCASSQGSHTGRWLLVFCSWSAIFKGDACDCDPTAGRSTETELVLLMMLQVEGAVEGCGDDAIDDAAVVDDDSDGDSDDDDGDDDDDDDGDGGDLLLGWMGKPAEPSGSTSASAR